MRLLFLSNLYPPYGQGGYEEWCQEMATQLRERGHEIIVLTSRHALERDDNNDPSWVRRELHLEMELVSLRNGIQFFTHRRQHERENLAILRSYINRFRPEGMVVWGMWNIVRSVPILAEALMPGRVVYYVGDYWPTLPSQFEFYWKAPAQYWYTQLPKAILGLAANYVLAQETVAKPNFERVIFPTLFMRNELIKRGMKPGESMVIYGAADTTPYLQCDCRGGCNHRAANAGKITLLYAGRIRSDKGVHIAIKALGRLVQDYGFQNVELLIAGTGDRDYLTFLEYLVRRHRLEKQVTFLGGQEKEAMPALYHQADIFLFTSVWQEPFGRVLVEAMAAGVAVVGSTVGGTAEILRDNETALTYPAGDAEKLAAQVARLIESPELRQQIATAGKQVALERFDIQRMAMEIESYLEQIVQQAEGQAAGTPQPVLA
jgi:glycosyltransferase involved in cell wall biosynthesis